MQQRQTDGCLSKALCSSFSLSGSPKSVILPKSFNPRILFMIEENNFLMDLDIFSHQPFPLCVFFRGKFSTATVSPLSATMSLTAIFFVAQGLVTHSCMHTSISEFFLAPHQPFSRITPKTWGGGGVGEVK